MIIDYLMEGLMSEARFDLAKPENYQFYGVDDIDSEADDEGNALSRFVGPYIFVFNENLYDMDIKTILRYPVIKNESGFIRYDEYGSKLKPVYVDANGDEYDLTDRIIKTNHDVQQFLKGVVDQLKVGVILDFSFDISEDDPSYDPDKSFDTLNTGSARDVFRKLNNVAYLIRDYISNFDDFVVNDVINKVFGPQYKTLTKYFQYYLTNIEFIGKQDFEGDMKRTNLYKKWFSVAGKEMGNMSSFNVDGVEFDVKYSDTRLA